MVGRILEAQRLIEALAPTAAATLYYALQSAEAKLTDARDACDETGGRLYDVLHLIRQDMRVLRRAANDARLK